jgi:microcompartment protein CcmK/EutM
MKLCTVLGSTVSTIKHPCYGGRKLLVVQPLDLQLRASGPSFLASDAVGAGTGETVLVCEEGRSAMLVFETPERTPLRSAVVAIVDHIDLGTGRGLERHAFTAQAAKPTRQARGG